MNRRGAVAASVLVAWGAGLGLFLRRETVRSPAQRLADVGARIAPGATWFVVERDGRQVGFASISIDTLPRALHLTEYMVVEDGGAQGGRRRSTELTARLSRTLELRDFERRTVAGPDSQVITGVVVDDSTVSVRVSGTSSDSGTLSHRGEALVAPLIPLVTMLRAKPRRGYETSFDVFELDDLTRRLVTARLEADSMFVVADSAVFDDARGRWVPAHRDSLRGWHLMARTGMAVDLWADELGQVLLLRTSDDLVLRRTAFEIAFENWRTSRSEVGGPRSEKPTPHRPPHLEPRARPTSDLRPPTSK
jgi:hypothetical protein